MEFHLCKLVKEPKQLILGNGSERGEFIPMKDVFGAFKKPHDGIQVMKTYYPNHDGWNTQDKISKSTKMENVDYAWDYEYDDYHPLDIFEAESVTLAQLQDIKKYGSDIHFTLTMDAHLKDEEIEQIFEKLKGFGRIYLRINHEENGYWFEHNKTYSRKEVAEFFVRCHKIVKRISSEFYTVFSVTADEFRPEAGVLADKLDLGEGKLKEALACADFWSIDKYISLNFGWPFYELQHKPDDQCFNINEDQWWNIVEETYLQMIECNDGIMKPLFINEFNSDSDVDGFDGQASKVKNIYEVFLKRQISWLKGIVMYQFQDDGGLGLVSCNEKGELQRHPSFESYKETISQRKESICERDNSDISFRWLNSEIIEGVSVKLSEKITGFTNRNAYTVFLYQEDNGEWTCLLPGESANVQTDKISIFVPPYDKEGTLQYTCNIDDMNYWLHNLMM